MSNFNSNFNSTNPTAFVGKRLLIQETHGLTQKTQKPVLEGIIVDAHPKFPDQPTYSYLWILEVRVPNEKGQLVRLTFNTQTPMHEQCVRCPHRDYSYQKVALCVVGA